MSRVPPAGLTSDPVIRISPELRARIDAAATRAGVERSAWVRGVVTDKLG